MNNIYIMTALERKEIETADHEFRRPAGVNPICKNCIMNCPGIKDRSYTGCVYKHTENFPEVVKELKETEDWDEVKRSMSDYEIEYLQKRLNIIL